MKVPKRHFYNNQDYYLDYQNQVMVLKPEFHDKLLKKTL